MTFLTQGKGTVANATNMVEYPAGHRALAPDFTATSLTGATIKMSSYRGKIVVLNFWGSWCPPCRAEAPTLAVLDEQYSSKGVAFLGDDVATPRRTHWRSPAASALPTRASTTPVTRLSSSSPRSRR